MFHTKIKLGADAHAITTGEIALRAYLLEYDEALGHAAVLLADRRGARLVNTIREGLHQPGPLTRRMHRLLLELQGLLFLENAHVDDWNDTTFFALLGPENPIVTELCVLADSFDEALRGAEVVTASDEKVA